MKGEDELAPDSTDDENVRENVEPEEEKSELRQRHERRLSRWKEEMDLLFNEKIPEMSRKRAQEKEEEVRKRAQEKEEEVRKMAQEKEEEEVRKMAQEKEEEEVRKMAEAIIETEKNEASVGRTQVRGSSSARRLHPHMYDKDGYLKPEFNPDFKSSETNLSQDRFREAFLDGWEKREVEKKSALEKEEKLSISRNNALEEEVVKFLLEIETIQRIRHGAKEGLDMVTIQLPGVRLPNMVVLRSSTSLAHSGYFHRGRKRYEGEFTTKSGFKFGFSNFYHRICEYLSDRGIYAKIEIKVDERNYVETERKGMNRPKYREWKTPPISGHIIVGFEQEYDSEEDSIQEDYEEIAERDDY